MLKRVEVDGFYDPLQTHADRMRMISGVVNFYAWTCIVLTVWWSLNMARGQLELKTWGPFAGTMFFLILTLLNLRILGRSTAQPRQPEADGLGSSPVR